jgi:hypothetical protein
LRFHRRRPTRRWRRRRVPRYGRSVKFLAPVAPRIYRVKHAITGFADLEWSAGAGEEDYLSALLPMLGAQVASTPLVAYLKSQYAEWLINKIEVTFSRLDGGITTIGAAAIDEDTREPKFYNQNNMLYSFKSMHETHLFLKMRRVVDKDNKTNDLEIPIENYKVLYPILRNNVPRYKKVCKFMIYPKCTKPQRTADKFWDNTTTIVDMIINQTPKNFEKGVDDQLEVAYAPFLKSWIPPKTDKNRLVDLGVRFQMNVNVYYSCFKRIAYNK